MKNENREVVQALILVLQFGINMLVPIFMCSMLGIWIGNRTGISWMMVPFFFVGALAGGTNVYRMAKKLFKESDRDAKQAKKDK
ncbi:MAG: AtpZ/AtpI family protein [Agathobacter sp.]|nr:AtpZ/AtpI family protein [Agathobacter sp.]